MPDPSSTLAPAVSSDTDAEPRQRFSEVLNDLARRPTPAVGLGNVPDAFGDRAFCALMLGRPTVWMPGFNCPQAIPRDFFALLTTKLSPLLKRAERILQRDGLATAVGWLATLGSILILVAVSSAIVAGVRAFLDQLWGLIG